MKRARAEENQLPIVLITTRFSINLRNGINNFFNLTGIIIRKTQETSVKGCEVSNRRGTMVETDAMVSKMGFFYHPKMTQIVTRLSFL